MKKNETDEYDNFDQTMRKLASISHDEIRGALDAEKREKQRKKKRKTMTPSASGHASGGKG